MRNISKVIALILMTCVSTFSFAETGNTKEETKNLSLLEWRALSPDDQEALIQGLEIEKYSNLRLIDISEADAMTKVTDAKALAFAQKMDQFMTDNVNFEIEDEHSRVGDVGVHWLNVLLLDGNPVGGAIGYFQKGCDLEEENYQYFETEEEAIQAGCDVNADVSWQAHGAFDQDLKPIRYDEYMEWSGY